MNVVFLGVYRTSSAGKRCMRFHLRWMSLHPVEAFACQLLEIEDDNIYWHVSCFTESYPKASVSTNFNGFSARGNLFRNIVHGILVRCLWCWGSHTIKKRIEQTTRIIIQFSEWKYDPFSVRVFEQGESI